eukprot:CAMPEP_0167809430 /NCGR_PEP_ID=MMETSP0111_2-20121227/23791_1 /TAXON_ID=91324 /ORGANISM="Lotharella globosa, Strain CCCM811" /LENGTH=59 /DNA_ID=CAMNT_0007707817 /DNA_START=11 /DNA_END=186 /DNA_ORIENTATION=-
MTEEEQDILDKLPIQRLSELLLPSNNCALHECEIFLQEGVGKPQESAHALLLMSKGRYA